VGNHVDDSPLLCPAASQYRAGESLYPGDISETIVAVVDDYHCVTTETDKHVYTRTCVSPQYFFPLTLILHLALNPNQSMSTIFLCLHIQLSLDFSASIYFSLFITVDRGGVFLRELF
jgi:hypothetical protein